MAVFQFLQKLIDKFLSQTAGPLDLIAKFGLEDLHFFGGNPLGRRSLSAEDVGDYGLFIRDRFFGHG